MSASQPQNQEAGAKVALERRLGWPRLVAITFFAFALGMVINSLEPAVLGNLVLRYAPQNKNTVFGFLTFAGLLVAIFWQPIVGYFSDHTSSRLGRRSPYLMVGTGVVVTSLYAIALAPGLGVIFIGLFSLQFGTNTVYAPWQALIPDQVPSFQRGISSAMKAAFEVLAFVAGRQISGQLVASGNIVAAVSVAAGLMILALVITLVTAKDREHAIPERTSGLNEILRRTFTVDWRRYPAFAWWFVNRFLFWFSFVALSSFTLFYVIDVFALPEPEAQRFAANLSTMVGIAVLLVIFPAGMLADRVGRAPLVALGGLLGFIGALLIVIGGSTAILIGAGVFLGFGVGIYLTANWALVTDIIPGAAAARYLGIASIAGAAGSATARLVGGVLIDPINHLTNSQSLGYSVFFGLTALAFLAGTLVILRMPKPDPTGSAED